MKMTDFWDITPHSLNASEVHTVSIIRAMETVYFNKTTRAISQKVRLGGGTWIAIIFYYKHFKMI
jgi:hypothetical protein